MNGEHFDPAALERSEADYRAFEDWAIGPQSLPAMSSVMFRFFTESLPTRRQGMILWSLIRQSSEIEVEEFLDGRNLSDAATRLAMPESDLVDLRDAWMHACLRPEGRLKFAWLLVQAANEEKLNPWAASAYAADWANLSHEQYEQLNRLVASLPGVASSRPPVLRRWGLRDLSPWQLPLLPATGDAGAESREQG